MAEDKDLRHVQRVAFYRKLLSDPEVGRIYSAKQIEWMREIVKAYDEGTIGNTAELLQQLKREGIAKRRRPDTLGNP